MRENTLARRIAFWLSVAAGLVFAIVPLPEWLDTVRPDVALLAVIYWTLASPRIAGLGAAWIAGLLLDMLKGFVLGQHALGFLVVGFVAHRLQLRMRMFTILQQAAVVLLLLFLYHFIVFWIDGMIGHGLTLWARWLPVLSGAVLWPLIATTGDSMSRRSR